MLIAYRGCGPAGRTGDARADIAAVGVDVAGDQREEPFKIGVAAHQRPIVAQLGLQTRQVVDDTVVGEDSAVLEGMGVFWA
jgi:hypothetical protein